MDAKAGMNEFAGTGLISGAMMRVVEENAIALGLSSLQMMESAGKSLAGVALGLHPGRILVLCGKGNNGGDGLVAARYLARNYDCSVIHLDLPGMTKGCIRELALLRSTGIPIWPVGCPEDVEPLAPLFSSADVIVDALLGTGASGAPSEPIASCVRMMNGSPAKVVAADVPTPGGRADVICAFHRPKTSGAVVADIGIPVEAEVFCGPGDLTLVPKKPPGAHKGAGGKVLVIGGGPFQGAPYLAGLGALRAGADIVRVASPEYLPIPEIIHERLSGEIIGEEHLDRLSLLARSADVVVVGNGLGDRSHRIVTAIAPLCKKAVFDADALRSPLPVAEETIYTPHAGEFFRMTGINLPGDLIERGRAVKEARLPGTVLQKGPVDVISDGNNVRFNRTGSPIMTAGGTGDVLAGVTAALFVRLPAFESACVAAYVNGRAGMAAEKQLGGGMLARELADRIPSELFGKEKEMVGFYG